ncbi:MAG: type II toxin-antitoxin system RelE/ParE family toxin [Clostridiales Family XIII bacterium]|nr:type II toxin-antitoxin system RelE/ParE family toxin [Clostridiales Family XIII bacterium]
MKEFKVSIAPLAQQDMRSIRRYISETLKEPAAAKRVYESIKTAVLSLGKTPLRNPIVRDEPYATLGIRTLHAENYAAFYLVDEPKAQVHIIRVLYSRREWQDLL